MMGLRRFSLALICVALVVAAPASVQASVKVGDLVKFTNSHGSPGGAFLVDNLNVTGAPDFTTFCAEITEYINFSNTYIVTALGQTNSSGKTLGSYAAWLFNSFLDGALNGFDPLSASDNNALQLAIWRDMGYTVNEVKSFIGTSWYNSVNTILDGKTWDDDFDNSDWTGTGYIEIMQLNGYNTTTGKTGAAAQDQLVRNVPPVPEPMSLLVWSILATCVAGICARSR